MQRWVRVFTASILCAAFAGPAWATTARRLSNEALTDEAQAIAIGTALDARSAWEGRILVTHVTVRVTETLKGSLGETITVVLPGGIDANRPVPVAMTYAGAPQIRPGEEVFLFLVSDAEIASGYSVAGFSQGKFSIVSDAGGVKVVTRDLSAVMLDSGSGIAAGSRSLVSLAEFRAEVAGYLK